MNNAKQIKVDEHHYLFNKQDLIYKEFYSDYRLIRFYTKVLLKKAHPNFLSSNLLEQQVSEIIRNAVRHGNKKDSTKLVKVWYKFSLNEIRLIVEDEGEGFQDLERWNEFNRKKHEYYIAGDIEKMADFLSFRNDYSTDEDGGNALFAAVEYWNLGLVFNNKRNAIAVGKRFHHSLFLQNQRTQTREYSQ